MKLTDTSLIRPQLRQNESYAGLFLCADQPERTLRHPPFHPAETAIVTLDYGSFSLQFDQPFLRAHKYLAGSWIMVSDRNSIRSALLISMPKRAPVSLIKFLREVSIR